MGGTDGRSWQKGPPQVDPPDGVSRAQQPLVGGFTAYIGVAALLEFLLRKLPHHNTQLRKYRPAGIPVNGRCDSLPLSNIECTAKFKSDNEILGRRAIDYQVC
jgi:hypothetical protein